MKKLNHPSWVSSCQSAGENSFLKFPWLLLLAVWFLYIKKKTSGNGQIGGKTKIY